MSRDNLQITVKGTKAIIEIDLSQNLGKSSSGKSIMIATTRGAEQIAPDVMANINIYKKGE